MSQWGYFRYCWVYIPQHRMYQGERGGSVVERRTPDLGHRFEPHERRFMFPRAKHFKIPKVLVTYKGSGDSAQT